MEEKKAKKRWPMMLVTAAFIALFMFALPYARGYLIRVYGLDATPKDEIPAIFVQPFLQNDARWSGDTLGDTKYSMGGHGCLVTCIAMSLCHMGIAADPGTVNSALAENGAYTAEGEMLWYKLKDIFGVVHEYQNDFGASTLEKLLAAGLPPIVRVKYRGGGVDHWVLVVGSTREDFLILDPLESSQKPIPLKTHGKIYAYRVLKKEEGA